MEIMYLYALLLLLLFVYLFYKDHSRLNYWKSKGISSPSSHPFLGHTTTLLMDPKRWLTINKLYEKYKSKSVWGMYEVSCFNLHVCDLDLIRDILVKDSDHFIDRRRTKTTIEKDRYFKEFLTEMQGDQWKAVRSIISPTFSSGKIKGMFSLINTKVKHLTNRIDIDMEEHGHIDLKKIFSLYTMDVISSCAFGIDLNSLRDVNSDQTHFVKCANDLMSLSPQKLFKLVLMSICPRVSDFFGLTFGGTSLEYLVDLVRETIEKRMVSKFRRGDFIDLLIDAKEEHDTRKEGIKYDFTQDTMISQAILFLLAGFDTTSNALSFSAFNLARSPSKQNILREKLRKLVDVDGGFNFQSIMECQYLDAVVNESSRLHSVAIMIERQCVKDYSVKSMALTIEKGTMVTIPAYSLHHDPDYWDEPEEFRPERFLPQNKDNLVPFTYMPFGIGPRNCIAKRFALMEVKVCLAALCLSYDFKVSPDFTTLKYEFIPGMMKPAAGSLRVIFEQIQ